MQVLKDGSEAAAMAERSVQDLKHSCNLHMIFSYTLLCPAAAGSAASLTLTGCSQLL